jgi:hypothetical protein
MCGFAYRGLSILQVCPEVKNSLRKPLLCQVAQPPKPTYTIVITTNSKYKVVESAPGWMREEILSASKQIGNDKAVLWMIDN